MGSEQDLHRTNTEKMAETRARMLDAVLESLSERGFAATSTTEVARRSGATRGAQLHHFGTKDQMMVAAVEHLEAQIRAIDVDAGFGRLTSPKERMLAALPILSQLFSSSLGNAYVELWVASRTHPHLVEPLRRVDQAARDVTRQLFGRAPGDVAATELDSLIDLTMHAVRGMAVDGHLATEEERADRVALILGLAPYFERAIDLED